MSTIEVTFKQTLLLYFLENNRWFLKRVTFPYKRSLNSSFWKGHFNGSAWNEDRRCEKNTEKWNNKSRRWARETFKALAYRDWKVWLLDWWAKVRKNIVGSLADCSVEEN